MKESVDNNVKLNRLKVAPLAVPIVPIELLVREVNCPALLTIKLPEMADGPSKFKIPGASGPTRMLPATVSQSAMAVASAWELIVIVVEESLQTDVCAIRC